MDRYSVVMFMVLFLLQASVHGLVEDCACNDHYRFDGLKFPVFQTEKLSYSPGDTVRVNYEIRNDFGSPLVEGEIKVLVLYRGADNVAREQDADILDDLVVLEDVNIRSGDSYPGYFEWTIPENAKPGFYVFNAYFPVKEKFNIAGISFMSSVPATKTIFEVKGADSDVFILDKDRTSINGEPYLFRQPIPQILPGETVRIKSYLDNPGNYKTNILYELFYWDDVDERMDSYTRAEVVTDSRELSYNLASLPSGVYVARIIASSGGWKSIIKTRFYVEGARSRFIWVGLDKFPLRESDTLTLSFCLSNSAAEPGDTEFSFPVKGSIRVTDSSGSVLVEESYEIADLSSNIDGKKISFVSPGAFTKLTVAADMYDMEGNLMDYVVIDYDYSKFLNIQRNFKLKAPQTATDSLEYSVEYVDEYKDPLAGDLVAYLSDSEDKVVGLDEYRINGAVTRRFSLGGLEDGNYVLKVVEKGTHLAAVKNVQVMTSKITSTTKSPPTTKAVSTTLPQDEVDSSMGLELIIIAALVLIVIFIVVRSMSKKEGKNKK